MRFGFTLGALALTGCLTLAAPLAAQSALVAGVGYSDRYGGFANVGLHMRGLFDGAIDFQLDYRRGTDGYDLTGRGIYRHHLGNTGLGEDTILSFGITAVESDWKVNSYSRRAVDFYARIDALAAPNLRVNFGLGHSRAHLSVTDPALSPVLLQDAGFSQTTWVEAGFAWATAPDLDLFTPGSRLSGTFARTISGDPRRNWSRAHLSADSTLGVAGPVVLGLSAEGSVIQPAPGLGVHANDRIFPDGRAPRGFAWGSAGPRDMITGDALGGTRQFFASTEFRMPLQADGLSLGAFADAGAVWNLAGDASTRTDDSYRLRSSAGLSLTWSNAMGRLDASWARPVSSASTDVAQPFSLRFVATF